MAAEVAVPPKDQRYIRLKGVSGSYKGFDRNPYAVAFRCGGLEFIAVSVHLFFGSHSYYDEDRRALEAYAVARWASQRNKAAGAYSQNILLMGDFNLPVRDDSNSVYRALRKKGLILPEHSTEAMGSDLAGAKHYDQVGFHNGGMKTAFTGNSGVFDFDRNLFAAAWGRGSASEVKYFKATIKRHIADHRLMWAEFRV
ncbi:MAG: endonuclease/exonuclease/phosphatase family metal-dependent hydrolase [Rhodothermales bacterium]